MGGSNVGSEPGVYGTLGLPASGNIPPARYEAVTWTDTQGNFWLFGGDSNNGLKLNDLWKFNPSTQEWGWMAGSSSGGQPGVYGTLGIPSVQNNPGGREDASGWVDDKGNFWLFGGYGLDATGAFGILNDLWRFDPIAGEWTWMSGSSTIGKNCFLYDFGKVAACAQPSVYGTLGTPASSNTPGSREAPITWSDNKGNLWLFGGWSYDVSVQTQYYFNELWEFSTSTNQWAWMGGTSTRDGSVCFANTNYSNVLTCGEPGVYGTLGAPASANIPGGRAGGARWTDNQGNLWLFSGSGFDVNGYFGDPNDLWKFDSTSHQWAWVGGNSGIAACADYFCSGPAVYGTLATFAPENIPPGRDHSVEWSDSSGNLWLFGGGGREVPDTPGTPEVNDIWEFNPSTLQWRMMGGSIQSLCGMFCGLDPLPIFGMLDVPAPGEEPGARFAPMGWVDQSGNFWLFGGEPPPAPGYGLGNDLWEYQPSAGGLPTTAPPTFSLPAGSYASAQSVTIGDSTNGAHIFFTTDGTTPTPNSPEFFPKSQPISIQNSKTLKAIAVAYGCFTSAVATATYTLPPPTATPTFSLPAGTYTSFETVSISDTTPGATIYYTTDGTPPTTNSTVYRGPLSIIGASTLLQAVSIAPGYSISAVASVTYTLNLPQASVPTFSLASGTYKTAQTVTLSDSTPGAAIYYEINNGYPTTSSPVYTGPITISSTETIWAMAFATNYLQSYPAEGAYTIDPLASQTATPVFSVPAGTYSSPQTVTISDATSGVFIYYTTDGSTPTPHSSIYTGAITVSSSETLQAVAVAYGETLSAVASAVYVITGATPSFSLSGTTVTVSPGSTSGNTSIISITPSGGFTGSVALTAAITSSPAGATNLPRLSFGSTTPVTISSNHAATATLTISTSAPTSASVLPHEPGGPWYFTSATTLVSLLLWWFSPTQRRGYARLGVVAFLLILLNCVVACGGVSGSGLSGGGGGSSGTTAGTYSITVTGTSGSLTQTGTVTLVVN